MIMCLQGLVSFCQFVLKILSKNQILTSIKGRNSKVKLVCFSFFDIQLKLKLVCFSFFAFRFSTFEFGPNIAF